MEQVFPLEFQGRLWWSAPFMLNHRISCEIQGARRSESKRCCDLMTLRLIQSPAAALEESLGSALNHHMSQRLNPKIRFDVC